jgi:hypothetical protein
LRQPSRRPGAHLERRPADEGDDGRRQVNRGSGLEEAALEMMEWRDRQGEQSADGELCEDEQERLGEFAHQPADRRGPAGGTQATIAGLDCQPGTGFRRDVLA